MPFMPKMYVKNVLTYLSIKTRFFALSHTLEAIRTNSSSRRRLQYDGESEQDRSPIYATEGRAQQNPEKHTQLLRRNMNKKLWLAVFATCTLISAIVFHVATTKRHLAAEIHPHSRPASETSPSVPEHIVYGFLFLFRNVARNNERNLELQAKGAVSRKYFAFKRELGFGAEQSRVLTEIASDCEFQVRQQDRNAQFIIAEFRAKLPKTKEAPPPPPQLKTMWEERNAIILRARDRLRAALGNETFERLDNFAKFRYGTNKAPVSLRPIDRGSE